MSVYFYGCMTLDGYLADKNHGLAWLDQTGDVEETGYSDFYKRMDITIIFCNRKIREYRGDLPVHPELCFYTFQRPASKGIYPSERRCGGICEAGRKR